jgi:hypothetical protein
MLERLKKPEIRIRLDCPKGVLHAAKQQFPASVRALLGRAGGNLWRKFDRSENLLRVRNEGIPFLLRGFNVD